MEDRTVRRFTMKVAEIKRVKSGRVLLIPGSDQTAGHGTTAQARFWKQDLAELLQGAPRRAK
jgi:homoserine O-acetyltransferase